MILIISFLIISIVSFSADFNGYDWGTSYKKISNEKHFSKNGEIEQSDVVNGERIYYRFMTYNYTGNLGNIEQVNYTYFFLKNKLVRGYISKKFKEESITNGIIKALNKKYGESNKKDIWNSGRTKITLREKKKYLELIYEPKKKIFNEINGENLRNKKFSKQEIEILSNEL